MYVWPAERRIFLENYVSTIAADALGAVSM